MLDPAICIYECPLRVFRECQNLPKQLHAEAGVLTTTRPSAPAPAIEPAALWRTLRSETPPLAINVREPPRVQGGLTVPGSQSIPLPRLLADLNLAPATGQWW